MTVRLTPEEEKELRAGMRKGETLSDALRRGIYPDVVRRRVPFGAMEVKVHFETRDGMLAFGRLIGRDLDESVRSLWWDPEREQRDAWWKKHWQGMPHFVQEDLTPYKTIAVHFKTRHKEAFSRLVGQKVAGQGMPEKIDYDPPDPTSEEFDRRVSQVEPPDRTSEDDED